MLLPVERALYRILAAVKLASTLDCPIEDADGRVLSKNVFASRDQPPFATSAMDGYAVRHNDLSLTNSLRLIGEAAAGRAFKGVVGTGETVRIFTGSPLPGGADTILIQENAGVMGDTVRPTGIPPKGDFVRPVGSDFEKDTCQLAKGTQLDFRSLSLAASLNQATLPVFKPPLVGILSNGDELVRPGDTPAPDQIIASNAYGLASLVRTSGGLPVDLGIAKDTRTSITNALHQAKEAGCDMIVTLGGASVGDHDLVKTAFNDLGITLDFWKIAMRPGKPLMFGRWGSDIIMLGLPGNPVSSLVCGLLFVRPILLKMQCCNPAANIETALLGKAVPKNSLRKAYLRCIVEHQGGQLVATAFDQQDSSMLSILNRANALLIRPPYAPAAQKGETCQIIRF